MKIYILNGWMARSLCTLGLKGKTYYTILLELSSTNDSAGYALRLPNREDRARAPGSAGGTLRERN